MDYGAILFVAAASLGIFVIAIVAMAVGVMAGRKSISGSCGGLASQTDGDGNTSCSLCSSPTEACEDLRKKMSNAKR